MRYTRPVYKHEPTEYDLPREGRTFRDVLEAVQNGMEQLGEQCSKSEYDFKKPDDVDMSVPVQIFVEKMDVGANAAMGDYEDRLADRLGFRKDEPLPNE